MTADQKEHAASLLRTGEKLEAVRYFQQTLGVDAEQALKLAEKLEAEEEESDQTILREQLNQLKAEMNSPSRAKFPQRIGLAFMSIGLILLASAGYLVFSTYQFIQKAQPVVGKVVNYDSHWSSDDDGGGSTMYTPTFEYTFNGSKRTFRSSTSSSSQDFSIGDTVEILVDPNDPKSILVNTFWEKYLLPVVLLFIGSMFTGLGYMSYKIFQPRTNPI